MASKKLSPKPDPSPLADTERVCAEARAAFPAALSAHAVRLVEQADPLGELIGVVARSGPSDVVSELRAACVAPLHEGLPLVGALDVLPGLDEKRRAALPIVGARMAAPFALTWDGALVDEATFEIHHQKAPLGGVTAVAPARSASSCSTARRDSSLGGASRPRLRRPIHWSSGPRQASGDAGRRDDRTGRAP